MLRIHPNEPSLSELVQIRKTVKNDEKKLHAIDVQIARHKQIGDSEKEIDKVESKTLKKNKKAGNS